MINVLCAFIVNTSVVLYSDHLHYNCVYTNNYFYLCLFFMYNIIVLYNYIAVLLCKQFCIYFFVLMYKKIFIVYWCFIISTACELLLNF